MKNVLNKSFIIENTDESSFIAEAFGIDAGYSNDILKDVEVPSMNDFDLLYITGESGSGKSVMLDLIAKETIVDIPETPLHLWGDDENKTLHMLSLVGLGDATLFMTKYQNLSDSQKARARIAKMLLDDNEIIVIDEFLSTLDRKTAKSVAFCFQKAIRKLNKKAIVVTAHDDLDEFLMPEYTIIGNAFPSTFETVKNNYNLNENKILKNIIVEYGDKNLYKTDRLGELHYKGKYTGGTKEFLYATLDGRLIGVLVSIYRIHDGGRRISRVVVHPSYRGCGLGKMLIEKYIEDFDDVDVVASMALFNPVFEKAGMIKTENSKIKMNSKLKKKLKEAGFDFKKNYSKQYCNDFVLNNETKFIFDDILKSVSYLVCPGGKYLDEKELIEKIHSESSTRARIIWSMRDRELGKFFHKK